MLVHQRVLSLQPLHQPPATEGSAGTANVDAVEGAEGAAGCAAGAASAGAPPQILGMS